MKIEERLQNIFQKLDAFFEKKSFDELSPQLADALLTYFSGARQESKKYNLTQQAILCKDLEDDMRWLIGFMHQMNIMEIER